MSSNGFVTFSAGKLCTLAIVGEKDLSYFHDIAQFICKRIPHAKLEVIPGVGHMSNMEAPDVCNELAVANIKESK